MTDARLDEVFYWLLDKAAECRCEKELKYLFDAADALDAFIKLRSGVIEYEAIGQEAARGYWIEKGK